MSCCLAFIISKPTFEDEDEDDDGDGFSPPKDTGENRALIADTSRSYYYRRLEHHATDDPDAQAKCVLIMNRV